jgi:nitronate monooxygenase
VPGANSLAVCGLRDGLSQFGQFCVATRLALALKGDVGKGLFFRGSERLPFGNAIRSVAGLMDCLLSGRAPNSA